jgi:hypothetical protein
VSAKPKPVLYWRVSPANGSLVFADPARAEEVDAIYRAITKSRTWGELEAALPGDEYEWIVSRAFDEEGLERPAPGEPFRSELVPGYCDGDYPPWLQREMADVLPEEVVARFGRREETCINGTVLQIDEEVRPRVVAMLLRAGYELVRREDLMFW